MKTLKQLLFLVTVIVFCNTAIAAKLPGPLVDTTWLKNNLDKVVILDVRGNIKSFTSKPRFTKDKKTGKLILVKAYGHIPGALFVDYSKLRSKKMINNKSIDKMLPDKAAFEHYIQSVGVN